MNNRQNNNFYQQIGMMFQVLVNEIIPRTPILAKVYGNIMYFGALDLLMDQYLIMIMDDYYVSAKETFISNTALLSRLTIKGYYSEWFGYGMTRFKKPSDRTLQYYPVSWEQVGYPGPSLSYLELVKEENQLQENLIKK